MDKKKIIVVSLVVLIFLSFFIVFDYLEKKNSKTISPNILSLTQPITTFSGVVEKIEGNKLIVSKKQTVVQSIEPPIPSPTIYTSVTPSLIPTPKVTSITYQVVITDKTSIVQSVPPINYLFQTSNSSPVAHKLTMKDIMIGQYITVSTQADLRTLRGNQFDAVVLNLPQKQNTLYGKITRLDKNTLGLRAFQPLFTSPDIQNTTLVAQEKDFTITVPQDIEISRMSYNTASTASALASSSSAPEKFALSDLKVGMQVTVFTDEDVAVYTKVTALRIEPVSPLPEAVAISVTPSITGE